MEENTTFNEKAVSTNLFVVIYRSFMNIPYAKEIYEALKSLGKVQAKGLEEIKHKEGIPYFEARYVLTEKLLRTTGIRQVLELASGMSPRGLYLSSEGVKYVEIDFPEAIELKKEVLEKVCNEKNISPPSNLVLIGGNVLDKKVFDEALKYFDQTQPVAITCEGLLRYVSFDDKEILLDNVHYLLSQTDGVWITPDIRPIDGMVSDGELAKQVMERTGIDGQKNLFTDLNHAHAYFNEHGFSIEQHSPMEVVSELVTPKLLEIDDRRVEDQLSHRYAFVLRVQG